MATTMIMPRDIHLPPTPPKSPNRPKGPHAIHTQMNSPKTPSHSSSDTSAMTSNGGPSSPQSRISPANTTVSSRRGPSTYRARLEDFELIHVVGKGTAGRVLLVRHAPTSKIRAMKAVSKRTVLAHDELTHTLTELNILKRFAIHEPHNRFVSKLYHSFTDRENFYFVMDFYPGGDLATQMEIYGVLGHHRTRFYAADIVQGLEDLHRHGIIVRDLKPENILLNSKGHAVLADFGLSKEFPYRGEPKKLHVVTYPGQPPLPEWAGAGAASSRLMPDGSRRLVVDRADSFVGTAEYLSPEVVECSEYSYAVDWWALGCIIFEGLIGRVPFRKEDGEPPLVLWNKILQDSWDLVLYDPNTGRLYEEHVLDDTTWHFIDALLQKDPLWRLTEPHVKKHGYFAYVDWETVRRGDYEDPFGLDIHPLAGYNMHYFPRLCLEQEPTVDMSKHDEQDEHDHNAVPSPLNDNALYALAQARYRTELENFTWSWQDVGRDRNNSPPSSADIEGFAVDMFEEEGTATEATSIQGTIDEEDETSAEEETVESPKLIETSNETAEVADEPTFTPVDQSVMDLKSLDINSAPSSPVPSVKTLPAISSPQTTTSRVSLDPPVSPPLSDTAVPATAPVPIDKPFTASPQRLALNLPTGLPSSGLSVSDVVSVPSPGFGSSTRFFRRHPRLPSVETVPIARLSVELNGTITRLEDEEWEELDLEGVESVPNGHNAAAPLNGFFARGFGQVLRRRPSTLGSSGLRRTVKTSDSSRDSSPTKLRPNPNLFGGGKTKKAIDKIKAFPKLRKLSESKAIHAQTAPISPPSPSRPEAARRHTESGWFERRSRLRKKTSVADSLKIVKSVSMSLKGEKRSERQETTGGLISSASLEAKKAPKVELTKTPPVDWALDEGWKRKSED
ncbi:kinase-like domain-containing protein [Naematelia encephala]|uniref:non-specific serine/threonine protein kinase n=1 Tax=Naematelia encephala TaxID=71784 RepID=A0A1Y2BJW0_9TREE|nr:kinase-like domain-containing protein [Naematelia encephala]